jgi:hypothetical protein
MFCCMAADHYPVPGTVAYQGIFLEGGLRQEFFRGVQQIQWRTEGRENVDLGAVAP